MARGPIRLTRWAFIRSCASSEARTLSQFIATFPGRAPSSPELRQEPDEHRARPLTIAAGLLALGAVCQSDGECGWLVAAHWRSTQGAGPSPKRTILAAARARCTILD